MQRARVLLATFFLCLVFAQPAAGQDEKTKRWWAHVQVLAADDLEGRDTGSAGYDKAAAYVTAQFEKQRLVAAGVERFKQPVPLRSIDLVKEQSSVEVVRNGAAQALQLFRNVTIAVVPGLPESVDAPMVFVGYGLRKEDLGGLDVKGKLVVYFNALPAGLAATERSQTAATRRRLLSGIGAAGTMSIDNPKALETPKWPVAYARAVSIVEAARPEGATPERAISLRLSAEAADEVLRGSGHSFTEILEAGAAGKPLPAFEIPASLRVKTRIVTRSLSSGNLLAVLPGSDPVLKQEYVVVSAHLDGYGIGEGANGDKIYNGAFDDAAYVAALIELAAHIRESGKPWKRSILFAVFTGEEKGLLGSNYFTSHLTIPKEHLVADINLDYLRPIFPLRILTTLGLEESSLGPAVREVAGPMGIRIQTDNEPERGLFRRSDQYNFLRIGVPAVAFIFGYEAGSPEEEIYRAWYKNRYHMPADDLKQPINFEAAAKFNLFFERLVEKVANADKRPAFDSKSQYGKANQ